MSSKNGTKRTASVPRFASFVTTYKRPAALKATIEQLLEQSLPPDYVLVVDNGASETDVAAGIIEAFPADRVDYHPMPENTGSAGGAAAGLKSLFEKGFDWVHWGDDDNPPKTADTFERLMELVAEAPDLKRVGAVAAFGTWWDWRRGRLDRPPDDALEGVVEADVFPGNGHAIVSRRAFEKVGLPRARFFFGRPDPEYSLRIRRAGLKILLPGDLYREYRTLAGRMNLSRRRSPVPKYEFHEIWRGYYGRRNHIHMMLRTFERPDLAVREALKTLVKMVASWRKGGRYGLKYNRLLGRALFDGFRGKLGRTVPPEPKPAMSSS